MANRRLLIHYFGPIQHADVQLHNLTVFVGPQATGKSLAMQLCYFMQWLERLVIPMDDSEQPAPQEILLHSLKSYLSTEISTYASTNTHICWYSDTEQEETRQEIWWRGSKFHLNDALLARVQRILAGKNSLSENEGVYIPAGRIVYSYVTPSQSMRIAAQRVTLQWPHSMYSFYELLEETIRNLWQQQEQQKRRSSAASNISEDTSFLKQRIQSIIQGQLHYRHNTILLDIGNKTLTPQIFAAGQMEIWPFCALVENGFLLEQSLEHVFFEEPEAHLHPGAQIQVMEIIAFLVNKGVEFLLTTHSPYMLYTLNNFLTASEILQAGLPLDADQRKTALTPQRVAAYRFARDGNVTAILEKDTGLINADELDEIADELGADFHELLSKLPDNGVLA
jgi:hypothetical protein